MPTPTDDATPGTTPSLGDDQHISGRLLAYADAIAVIQETSRLLNPAAGQRLVCREVTQRLVDAMEALRDEGLPNTDDMDDQIGDDQIGDD